MSSNTQSLEARMMTYVPKDTLPSRQSIIVRLDGRAFSKFTGDLEKPYSDKFGECMRLAARYLCDQFNPTLVHTQSDEITMLFDYTDRMRNDYIFGGRIDKINSTFAAAATGKFIQALLIHLPDKLNIHDSEIKLPEIDCRCYAMPDKSEATNVFLWRSQDCVRNSVQMLARSFYSHSKCQNKSVKELLTLLDEDGINWADYPDHFREGTYYRKRKVTFGEGEESYVRNRVVPVTYHKFGSFTNRLEVVFNDDTPTTNKALTE